MTGVEIEYLLGLYFTISSIGYSYPGRAFVADGIRLIIGVVLIIFAAVGISLVH